MSGTIPPSNDPTPGPAPISTAVPLEVLRAEQNLPMGVLGALGAALIGAVLWAVVSVATGYQIGYMAVAVGFLVGYANRMLGKGIDNIFGIVGAVCALIGCLLGNLFTVFGYLQKDLGVSVGTALSTIGLSGGIELMTETFSAMDLLFYGIAIYEGYKFSFRQVDPRLHSDR